MILSATRQCRDWRRGRCHRGDACRYRHGGPEDWRIFTVAVSLPPPSLAEAVTFDRCACIDTFLENLRRRFLQETIRSNSEEFEWIPEEKIIPEDPAESPPPDCRLAGGYLGNYVRGISQDLGLSATAV